MVHVSVNLLAGVWPQITRLRRGRGYAPTNNTASKDNHEKINSWVSIFSYMGMGPLGAPSGRGSSAINF